MTDSDRERDAAEREELDDEIERTRRLILERRNRFMAAALAGIGMAAGACTRASVCLDVPVDTSGSGGGGGSGGSGGTRPSVCLSGRGAIDPVGGSGGTRPSVCLGAVDPCSVNQPPCDMDDGGIEDAGEQT